MTAAVDAWLAHRDDLGGSWGDWDRKRFDVEDFAAGFVRFASDTIRRQQSELGDQVARLRELLKQNNDLHTRVRRATRRTGRAHQPMNVVLRHSPLRS